MSSSPTTSTQPQRYPSVLPISSRVVHGIINGSALGAALFVATIPASARTYSKLPSYLSPSTKLLLVGALTSLFGSHAAVSGLVERVRRRDDWKNQLFGSFAIGGIVSTIPPVSKHHPIRTVASTTLLRSSVMLGTVYTISTFFYRQ